MALIENGTVLFTPYLDGQSFVADLTRRIRQPASSEQWIGGFWDYSFQIVAAPDSPDEVAGIIDAFFNWLGYHIEKRYQGDVVWDGMITQMDLAYGRVRRRRSLIDSNVPVYNATRSTYNGGTTFWYTDDASIARYGRIEKTFDNSTYTQAEAENLAQMELANRAWPFAFVISISDQVQTPTLDVVASGYWLTAAWQDSDTTITTPPDNLSDVVNDLITNDCPFLTVGKIHSNAFQVSTLDGTTALKRIENLAALGDGSLVNHRAWVGPGRKFYYAPVDLTVPQYRLTQDGLRNSLASPLLAPDEVRVGVIRDEAWPVNETAQAKYSNVKDILVTEVVSRGGQPGDMPELRTAEVDDGDIYAAQTGQTKDRAL